MVYGKRVLLSNRSGLFEDSAQIVLGTRDAGKTAVKLFYYPVRGKDAICITDAKNLRSHLVLIKIR
jgi:hypothetical protein